MNGSDNRDVEESPSSGLATAQPNTTTSAEEDEIPQQQTIITNPILLQTSRKYRGISVSEHITTGSSNAHSGIDPASNTSILQSQTPVPSDDKSTGADSEPGDVPAFMSGWSGAAGWGEELDLDLDDDDDDDDDDSADGWDLEVDEKKDADEKLSIDPPSVDETKVPSPDISHSAPEAIENDESAAIDPAVPHSPVLESKNVEQSAEKQSSTPQYNPEVLEQAQISDPIPNVENNPAAPVDSEQKNDSPEENLDANDSLDKVDGNDVTGGVSLDVNEQSQKEEPLPKDNFDVVGDDNDARSVSLDEKEQPEEETSHPNNNGNESGGDDNALDESKEETSHTINSGDEAGGDNDAWSVSLEVNEQSKEETPHPNDSFDEDGGGDDAWSISLDVNEESQKVPHPSDSFDNVGGGDDAWGLSLDGLPVIADQNHEEEASVSLNVPEMEGESTAPLYNTLPEVAANETSNGDVPTVSPGEIHEAAEAVHELEPNPQEVQFSISSEPQKAEPASVADPVPEDHSYVPAPDIHHPAPEAIENDESAAVNPVVSHPDTKPALETKDVEQCAEQESSIAAFSPETNHATEKLDRIPSVENISIAPVNSEQEGYASKETQGTSDSFEKVDSNDDAWGVSLDVNEQAHHAAPLPKDSFDVVGDGDAWGISMDINEQTAKVSHPSDDSQNFGGEDDAWGLSLDGIPSNVNDLGVQDSSNTSQAVGENSGVNQWNIAMDGQTGDNEGVSASKGDSNHAATNHSFPQAVPEAVHSVETSGHERSLATSDAKHVNSDVTTSFQENRAVGVAIDTSNSATESTAPGGVAEDNGVWNSFPEEPSKMEERTEERSFPVLNNEVPSRTPNTEDVWNSYEPKVSPVEPAPQEEEFPHITESKDHHPPNIPEAVDVWNANAPAISVVDQKTSERQSPVFTQTNRANPPSIPNTEDTWDSYAPAEGQFPLICEPNNAASSNISNVDNVWNSEAPATPALEQNPQDAEFSISTETKNSQPSVKPSTVDAWDAYAPTVPEVEQKPQEAQFSVSSETRNVETPSGADEWSSHTHTTEVKQGGQEAAFSVSGAMDSIASPSIVKSEDVWGVDQKPEGQFVVSTSTNVNNTSTPSIPNMEDAWKSYAPTRLEVDQKQKEEPFSVSDDVKDANVASRPNTEDVWNSAVEMNKKPEGPSSVSSEMKNSNTPSLPNTESVWDSYAPAPEEVAQNAQVRPPSESSDKKNIDGLGMPNTEDVWDSYPDGGASGSRESKKIASPYAQSISTRDSGYSNPADVWPSYPVPDSNYDYAPAPLGTSEGVTNQPHEQSFSIMDSSMPDDQVRQPRAMISWGFGGSLVVCVSSPSSEAFDASRDTNNVRNKISVFDMAEISQDNSNEDWTVASEVVNALDSTTSDLRSYADMCERLSTYTFGSDRQKSESVSYLWRFLAILSRNPRGNWHGRISELLAVRTSVPMFERGSGTSEIVKDSPLRIPTVPEGSSNPKFAQSAKDVEGLLCDGKRQEAMQLAQGTGLWPLALVIASSLDNKVFMDTVSQYARQHLVDGTALQTLCLSISENDEELIRLSCSSEGVKNWKKTVAVLLNRMGSSGSAEREFRVISKIGDALASLSKDFAASHLCHLISGKLQILSPGSDQVGLLGAADIISCLSRSASAMTPILQSVVYEAIFNAQHGKNFPHLLPFRLVLVKQLIAVGKLDTALQHCESIITAVRKCLEGPNSVQTSHLFTAPFLAILESTQADLQVRLNGAASASAGKLSALKQSLTSIFKKTGGDVRASVTNSTRPSAAPSPEQQINTTKPAAPVFPPPQVYDFHENSRPQSETFPTHTLPNAENSRLSLPVQTLPVGQDTAQFAPQQPSQIQQTTQLQHDYSPQGMQLQQPIPLQPVQHQSPHQQQPQPMQLQIPPIHQSPMQRQSPQERPMMPPPLQPQMQPPMPSNFDAPQPSMPNQTQQPPISYGRERPRMFMPQQNMVAGNSTAAPPDNRSEPGKTRFDMFVSNTINALAPADGDLSPPPRQNQGDFSHPGMHGQVGPNHPRNLANLRSASVGDFPSVMSDDAPHDQGSMWGNQDVRRFSQGNLPPLNNFDNKNGPSSSGTQSERPEKPSTPGHRRSMSDMTGALTAASNDRPPRPPKGKDGSETAARSNSKGVLSSIKDRFAARILGAFGAPKQAHMGSKNQYVYDEKLKRWVIPGEEVEDEDTLVPPPPDDDELSSSGFSNLPDSLQQTPDSSTGQLRQDVPVHDQAWPNLDPSIYNNGQNSAAQQSLAAQTSSGSLPQMGAAPSPRQLRQGYPPSMGYRSGPPSTSGNESVQNDFPDNASESSAASVASAPAPRNNTYPGIAPPAAPMGNKYRAGKVRGRRAYVDTFNPFSQSTGAIAPPGMPMIPRPASQSSIPGAGVNIFRPPPAPIPAPAQAPTSSPEQNWQNNSSGFPGGQQQSTDNFDGQLSNRNNVGFGDNNRPVSESFVNTGMNHGAFDNMNNSNTRPASERVYGAAQPTSDSYGLQPASVNNGYGGPGGAENFGGVGIDNSGYGGYGGAADSFGSYGGQGGGNNIAHNNNSSNFGGPINGSTSFEDSTSVASVNATSGPEGGYGAGSFVETSNNNNNTYSQSTQASQYRQGQNQHGIARMSA